MKQLKGPTHAWIPDLQNKPGEPLNQVEWIGKYLAEKKPTHIINAGDHFDMAALSFYDRGKKDFEGRRYVKDLEAGELANSLLLGPSYDDGYDFTSWFLHGNHEERAVRFVDDHAELEGFMSPDDMNLEAWYHEIAAFRVPIIIDGVAYSHFFYNENTGRPYGGMIETRIKNVGMSFTMGHQQGVKFGNLPHFHGTHYGLIAGSAYLHYEKYKGPQGNDHWQGIVLKYNVSNGEYDPSFISLDSLCRRYEGMSLAQFMRCPALHIGV